jgi:hypothetical protein
MSHPSPQRTGQGPATAPVEPLEYRRPSEGDRRGVLRRLREVGAPGTLTVLLALASPVLLLASTYTLYDVFEVGNGSGQLVRLLAAGLMVMAVGISLGLNILGVYVGVYGLYRYARMRPTPFAPAFATGLGAAFNLVWLYVVVRLVAQHEIAL